MIKVSLLKVQQVVNQKKTTWWTTYVNRQVAMYFTLLFWRLDVRPNFVTFLSFLFNLCGSCILFFSAPNANLFILSITYLLWNLGYVFDSVDGQLSRVTGRGSKFGEWLDHSLDPLNKSLIILSMFYFNFLTIETAYKQCSYVVGGLAISAVLVFFNAMMYKNLLFGIQTQNSSQQKKQKSIYTILSLFFELSDHGIMLFLIWLLLYPKLFFYGASVYFFCFFLGFVLYILIRFMKSKSEIINENRDT